MIDTSWHMTYFYLFDAECLVHLLVLVAVVTEDLLPRLQVIQGDHSHDGAQHGVRREHSVPGQQGIMNGEQDKPWTIQEPNGSLETWIRAC